MRKYITLGSFPFPPPLKMENKEGSGKDNYRDGQIRHCFSASESKLSGGFRNFMTK